MELLVEYNFEGWLYFQEFNSIYPVFIAKLRVMISTDNIFYINKKYKKQFV